MEAAPKHRESWKEFLKRKQINFTVQTYLIDALGAMAFGLFASLLIGTIFSTIGEKTGVEVFNTILRQGSHRSRPGRIHCLCLKSAAAGTFFRRHRGDRGQ